jgi:hypothetical protein
MTVDEEAGLVESAERIRTAVRGWGTRVGMRDTISGAGRIKFKESEASGESVCE